MRLVTSGSGEFVALERAMDGRGEVGRSVRLESVFDFGDDSGRHRLAEVLFAAPGSKTLTVHSDRS